MYFEQLSGAGCTQKLIGVLFWAVFNLSVDFICYLVIYVTEVEVRVVKLGRLSSLEFPFLEQDH